VKWDENRTERLKKYWAERLSYSEIARKLGITKNAVIGKASRLKLSGRFPSVHPKKLGRFRKRTVKPMLHPERSVSALGRLFLKSDGFVPLPEEIVIPIKERKTIQTLEDGDCRWPIGDPQTPDFHFCGGKQKPGLSYCGVHAERAYQTPQVRRPATVVEFPAKRETEDA
jgi:GcrA cell cycle regulator